LCNDKLRNDGGAGAAANSISANCFGVAAVAAVDATAAAAAAAAAASTLHDRCSLVYQLLRAILFVKVPAGMFARMWAVEQIKWCVGVGSLGTCSSMVELCICRL